MIRSRRKWPDCRRSALTATVMLCLPVAASAQNFDQDSLAGLQCATVLHGLAGASGQADFEQAGFKRADAPEYQGRADFWFNWVAKRVGRPRGQLEQGVMSDTGQIGQAISLIADTNAPPQQARALFKQLKNTVRTCVEYQAAAGKADVSVYRMQLPQTWPPPALTGAENP